MDLKVSEINIFPIKSCGGLSLQNAEIVDTGFAHDREWMVVDEYGQFITQRQYPAMTLIQPSLSADSLALSAPDHDRIAVPIQTDGKKMVVTVWESSCEAVDQGDGVAAWLSAFLGKPARLVRMAQDFKRTIKTKYQINGVGSVGFADSLPFLLISQASLDELNGRLAHV